MHPEDRDLVSWLVWFIIAAAVLAVVIAGLAEKGDGQTKPVPAIVPARVQLRYFPLEGTGLYCIAAVTTQDAAPGLMGLATRPLVESFNWIECRPAKEMHISPTPSPAPTAGVVG